MLFADRLSFDHPRKTADGYLVARARASRSGIYEYSGSEIDPKGEHFAKDDTVRVYRPEHEVFAADSVASFLMKPVTNNHPAKPVTADNWRQYAKGVVGKALRDGEYLAFDIVLMDKATIADVESGKRELSNGYASEIEFTAGQTEDGRHFDAIQKQIRGNHVAIVDKGRAGPLCRIGDAVECASLPAAELIEMLTDGGTYNAEPPDGKTVRDKGDHRMATKTITVDGLQVEVTDQAEAAITKLQGQLKDERDGRVADKAAHDKAIAAKDAEIDDLKGKVIDEAKIDALADAKAAIVADAKAIAGDKLGETAGKTVSDVRRMACAAVLGDAAVTDKSDEYIEARFDMLKDAKGDKPDALRDAIKSKPATIGDNSAVRDAARQMMYS